MSAVGWSAVGWSAIDHHMDEFGFDDDALANFDLDSAIAAATQGAAKVSLPSASSSLPSPLDGGRREEAEREAKRKDERRRRQLIHATQHRGTRFQNHSSGRPRPMQPPRQGVTYEKLSEGARDIYQRRLRGVADEAQYEVQRGNGKPEQLRQLRYTYDLSAFLFHNRTLLFSVRKLQSESLGITEAASSCAILELPATHHSDDDEAFALVGILPFQLGCHGTAVARAAVLVMKEARPGSWWHRGEGAPLPSCLGVSGSRGPLTSASSRLLGAARAGQHLRVAGLQLVAAGLSTPLERRAPRPHVGGSDHHHAYLGCAKPQTFEPLEARLRFEPQIPRGSNR
jgi:hypothetical protein